VRDLGSSNGTYVKDLTQAYYYGMKAFFSRSYEFQGQLLERQYGTRSQYKTRSGALREVGLQFLSGTAIEEPKPDVADLTRAIQEESKRIAGASPRRRSCRPAPPSVFGASSSTSPYGRRIGTGSPARSSIGFGTGFMVMAW
jgi:hypothetical protein